MKPFLNASKWFCKGIPKDFGATIFSHPKTHCFCRPDLFGLLRVVKALLPDVLNMSFSALAPPYLNLIQICVRDGITWAGVDHVLYGITGGGADHVLDRITWALTMSWTGSLGKVLTMCDHLGGGVLMCWLQSNLREIWTAKLAQIKLATRQCPALKHCHGSTHRP